MGNIPSLQTTYQKISFEDIQYAIRNPEQFLFINTLSEKEQKCLLPNTLPAEQEETVINRLLQKGRKDISIIIYGRNTNDEKIYQKYAQLISLGFFNVYLYLGGIFEWLLLQDIYGNKEFPTTNKEVDLLKYKANKTFGISLLEYH
jgi:rhodanese-related sulfurtransferase